MLVFDPELRLLAVLLHLSPENEVAPGHWYLEAGFYRLGELSRPTFPDLSAAEDWSNQRASAGGFPW